MAKRKQNQQGYVIAGKLKKKGKIVAVLHKGRWDDHTATVYNTKEEAERDADRAEDMPFIEVVPESRW